MSAQREKALTVLTDGPIGKRIISFAIPLFLGNLFQQLYNTADSLIVGNFLGSEALAAVSSSGSLIFLMVGFFNGISMGAGVIVARYYGAKQTDRLQKAIHTLVAFGLAAGLLLMVLGMAGTPMILRWMGTPENVLPNSIVYFRVYFAGSLGFVLYNVFMGILQSVGDSRHPLMYLIISSCINVALDLLFVGVFRMGVGSAALATVIAQTTSACLSFIRLLRSAPEYRIHVSRIRFDMPMLKQIISYGLPAGIQNSIISLANVVVQSNINAFGAAAMAGCGAYSKIEGFGILCSITIAELVGIGIYLAAPILISLFAGDPEVIGFGVTQARTVTLFYFLLALSHCMAGIFRGAGKTIIPMTVMMVCWCAIRISYITIIMRFVDEIQAIFWAYPITWTLSSVVFLIYFFQADWVHSFERREA